MSGLCAQHVIDLINSTIEEQHITSPDTVHLFLDEMDITEKDPIYDILTKQHRYEEAFSVPNVLTEEGQKLLLFCSRMGIRVVLYTTRVDTRRVEATVNLFHRVLDSSVPAHYRIIGLRDMGNILKPISACIADWVINKESKIFGIIACGYKIRVNDFLENAVMFEHRAGICF